QILKIRKALEKENPLHQALGMPHFVDRCLPLVLRETLETPVLEHFRVKEILIDGGELVRQHRVQPRDYFRVTLHRPSLYLPSARRGGWRTAEPRQRFGEERFCARRASSATQPDAEMVGELVGRALALFGGLDDVAIGDGVAKTDVHDAQSFNARSMALPCDL